jgi:uncharacterized protein (TIGR03382 family)
MANSQVAPDWTDHNVHDPGITLLEALAYTMGTAAFLAVSVAALRRRRRSREPDPG